jgi:hypothetical protein
LPPTGQVHAPPGPHTIGRGGAASAIVLQSLSSLHGYSGRAQIPQPTMAPPGLQERNVPTLPRQSSSELQGIAPSGSGRPASDGQAIAVSRTVQTPLLHVAVTLHP